MKKKIGIFTGFYLPHLGGVERYVDKLTAALQKLGYEVVIVTSNHDNLKETEQIKGSRVYRLPVREIAKNRYPIIRRNDKYRQLIRQIEDEKIDYYILNTRFYLFSHIGASMGRRTGRPVMLIEHGTDHFTVNNKLLDFFGAIYEHFLTSLIKRKVDGFYGVSKKCNQWLKHFSIKASGVFYNAIDVADQKNVKDIYKGIYKSDEIVISFAGRLIKEKGILNLLQAFQEVKQKNPELKIRLAIAGDGPLMQKIRNEYDDPTIDILGKLDFEHMMSLYKRTDIFVNPSMYPEGLPTSILEAGLMGCAIIATPKGGTEEVICDSGHGIIVDGSIESMRRAIVKLARDKSQRKLLSQKVKARIETVFNWDATAKTVDQEIKKFKDNE